MMAAALLALQSPAAGEFKGRDSLLTDKGKWSELFPTSSRGRLIFRDGDGLVYRTRSATSGKFAFLKWKPHAPGVGEDWFAQVTVDLNHEDKSMAGLAVLNASNREQGFMVTVVGGKDFASIRAQTMGGHEARMSRGSRDRAILRLRHEARTGLITASWNLRGVWRFMKPFDSRRWNLPKDGSFHIVLLARQVYSDGDKDSRPGSGTPAAKAGGDPFFRNFICGTSRPRISLQTGGRSPLPHPSATVGFGAVAIGRAGMTRTLLLGNVGTKTLTGIRLRKAGDQGAHFRLKRPARTLLKPGEIMEFTVRFNPSAPGLHRASVIVDSNDPRALPQTIRVSGRGIPAR